MPIRPRTAALLIAVVVNLAWADEPARSDRPADDRPIIEVATIDELIAAIGPNRIIHLKPGRYEIDRAKRVITAHVRWGAGAWGDRDALTIRKADHLTIQGLGEKPVALITNRDTWVLHLVASDHVQIINLELGHSPMPAGCTGGVLRAVYCDDVTIARCVLFGSGTEGFDVFGCTGFVAERCVVHSCTYGIAQVVNSENVRFTRCQFYNNVDASVVRIVKSSTVQFTDTVIRVARKRSEPQALFEIDPPSTVTVRGGGIEGLDPKLWNPDGNAEFDDVKELPPIR